jgi:hypothetical protein
MAYQQLYDAAMSIPLGANDLIYVAIGCSQKHYQTTGHGGSPQEYPPFVAEWPGRKLCILIDPDLEESPVGIVQARGAPATLADAVPLTLEFATGRPSVTFIALRRMFHWYPRDEGYAECKRTLDWLIQPCLAPHGPHMIVQDYSGTDIRQFFPVEPFGTSLMAKVLFDITGGDAGCFVDFSKFRVVRDPAGHFVQPAYTPLWKLKALRLGKAYEDQIRDRYNLALDSAARCWRAQNGHDQPRDWYAPHRVADRIKPLLYAYGIDPVLANRGDEPLIPFAAVEEPIFDLCAAVGHYMSHEEIYSMVTGSFDQLRESLKMLRDLALEEQNPPNS